MIDRDYAKHAISFGDEELDNSSRRDTADFDDDTFDDNSVDDMEYVRMFRHFPPAQRDLLL